MYWEAGSAVSFPLGSLYPWSPVSRIFELHVVLPFTEFTPSYFIEYSMYDSLVSCRLRIASKRKSKANFHRKWFRTCLSEKIPILCISFRGMSCGVLSTVEFDSAGSCSPQIMTPRCQACLGSWLCAVRLQRCPVYCGVGLHRVFKTWTVVVWIRIANFLGTQVDSREQKSCELLLLL